MGFLEEPGWFVWPGWFGEWSGLSKSNVKAQAWGDVLKAASCTCFGRLDAKAQGWPTWSSVFGDWVVFRPGMYVGKKYKTRIRFRSLNTQIITPVVDALTVTVDMPDRVELGTGVSCPAPGLTVTYATAFQVAPNVQITIINAQAGDMAVVSGESVAGFTIQVLNGGAGVIRTINWLAQGY